MEGWESLARARPCSSKLFRPLPLSLLVVRLRAKVAAAVPGLGGSWKLDCRSAPAAMVVKAFLDFRAKLGWARDRARLLLPRADWREEDALPVAEEAR